MAYIITINTCTRTCNKNVLKVLYSKMKVEGGGNTPNSHCLTFSISDHTNYTKAFTSEKSWSKNGLRGEIEVGKRYVRKRWHLTEVFTPILDHMTFQPNQVWYWDQLYTPAHTLWTHYLTCMMRRYFFFPTWYRHDVT